MLGGIDYTALALVKNDVILRRQQKKLCSWLNAYVRMPGGIFCATLILKDGLSSPSPYNYPLLILSSGLYYNATYYGKQAIESYGAFVGKQGRAWKSFLTPLDNPSSFFPPSAFPFEKRVQNKKL